nr:MAG TPA: hypothetical protein [Caudoviricetes sp.]DAT18675.1 MAG TPA: hypothetical protein [Caudoviricetes sp.]
MFHYLTVIEFSGFCQKCKCVHLDLFLVITIVSIKFYPFICIGLIWYCKYTIRNYTIKIYTINNYSKNII